jgi:outer membrane biosynthesis protein TonB
MSRCAALALAVFLVASAGAANPAFDKALRDSLADVHNKGADLYNQGKDYAGAYRLYEGALRTSRPLLAHRPTTQKLIEESLTAAGKESDPARKAFLLHEAIEKVRADLKDAAKAAPEPKKTVEPEPKKTTTPEPKKTTTPEPEPKKTTTPEPKKTPEPEPKKTTTPEPEPKKSTPEPKVTPEPKKTTTPEPKKGTEEPKKSAAGPGVSGVVTYKGQPVPNADVMFISLDRPAPVAVATKTGADGAYTVAGLAPGRYAVTVSATANGKAVTPPRFATTDTSGLTVTVAAGANSFNIALQ